MCVGYVCCLLHLLTCGRIHAERDVAVERVVEEDGFLIDVADELAKVMDAKILYVYAVDEHLSLLHVVITRDKIHESRLS